MTDMTLTKLRTATADKAPRTSAHAAIPDDTAMLRAAVELTRDISAPNPRIYWSDFLGSAALGYGALAAAIMADTLGLSLLAGLVAVLALYRAGAFIHELTHVKHSALPGFRLGWNLLLGIPLLTPSFLYEGVHNLHHARTRYGTADDPEYLPLALMKPWSLPLFLTVALFAPLVLMVRFAVIAPLSAVIPPLRRLVVARYSGLSINPAFTRRVPEGELRKQWFWQEAGASVFAIALLAGLAIEVITPRAFLIMMMVISAIALLNQVRTMVAHLWENDGEPMSVTAQYLDSVNVPPPSPFAALWAPVGLRYHALHHLLPSLPYHSLATAHRRLLTAGGANGTYAKANYPTLGGLIARLARSTMSSR